jgi:hypothetical protein
MFTVPTLNSATSGIVSVGSFLTTAGAGPLGVYDWGAADVFAVNIAGRGSVYRLGLTTANTSCCVPPTFTPHPGDLISVTVSVSKIATIAAITDVTQATSQSQSGPGASNVSLVGVGVEADGTSGTPAYLADFGKLRIFKAAIDGVTPMAAGAVAVNMKTYNTGILQVRTGALNTTGNAWNEVWKNP